MLFFPDGYGALESVDEPTAGVESGGAVSGEDGNQDATLANFDATQTMNDKEIANGEFRASFGRKLLELPKRHGFVRFIVKKKGATSATVIAHDSVKDDD